MINKLFLAIKLVFYYIFSNTLGPLQYDKKYFKGKWFEKWSSKGWEMVYRCFGKQYFGGINHDVRWPVSERIVISGNPENIFFDVNDINNFWGLGNYFQCIGSEIYIGKGTFIATNVGIVTTNHDFQDLHKHTAGRKIVIGNNSWIGMNAIILPGVELGDNTIVGAGSVVTKSFIDGNCVIAGNPAKIIKKTIV